MYPDWYPGTARNIAEEALSISVDLSLRDESENTSMLNGDPKHFELSAANNHSTFLAHTAHRHTLLNETTLSLLGMCQIRPCPLEILFKALEMLDILFQLFPHRNVCSSPNSMSHVSSAAFAQVWLRPGSSSAQACSGLVPVSEFFIVTFW
jgi:hypothetical protein